MSVQRGAYSRTLHNYFHVKKSVDPYSSKKNIDSLKNKGLTCKRTSSSGAETAEGKSAVTGSPVNVINSPEYDSAFIKETSTERCRDQEPTLNNHQVVILRQIPTSQIPDHTSFRISRKRKASSTSEEVIHNNRVKAIKLDSLSGNGHPQVGEQELKSTNVKVGSTDSDSIKFANKKTMPIAEIKKKLLKPENATVLKQVIESKKIIDTARQQLTLHNAKGNHAKKDEIKTVAPANTKSEVSNVPQDKVPAYQRFHSLASSEPASTLVLPFKYKVLSEMFRCLDTAVGIMNNRKEISTFNKVKAAVQEMMRRAFELHHLGQIKTVFPTAFHLQQEKLPLRGVYSIATECQLTVTQNVNCFAKSQHDDVDSLVVEDKDSHPSKRAVGRLKPGFLVARRKYFHEQLLEIVKKYHHDFLLAQNPPIHVESHKLIRWHPQFRVDEVPDVLSSELPLPEELQNAVTAKEVFTKLKGFYSKKIDNALEQVILKSGIPSNAGRDTQQKDSAALKGIPLSVLEKIRAKEAAKLKEEMTRNPAVDTKLKMISRLPEMARIVRTLFISEKKSALPVSYAVEKLLESYNGSLSEGEMNDHLNLLAELIPEWASMVNIRNGIFIKINKTLNFNIVISTLENAHKNHSVAP